MTKNIAKSQIPRQCSQIASLSNEFSDEEMVRDWTLTEADKHVLPNGTYFIDVRFLPRNSY
ncbi:MAG: hypothetical protein K0R49_753 [Burkholderiales bacterium]|jgi:hypothetical protein|nr:hypothetical protein [Burkholderiales bacterium]